MATAFGLSWVERKRAALGTGGRMFPPVSRKASNAISPGRRPSALRGIVSAGPESGEPNALAEKELYLTQRRRDAEKREGKKGWTQEGGDSAWRVREPLRFSFCTASQRPCVSRSCVCYPPTRQGHATVTPFCCAVARPSDLCRGLSARWRRGSAPSALGRTDT
jgi:hypothetical protein